jgi:hypothetical protein
MKKYFTPTNITYLPLLFISMWAFVYFVSSIVDMIFTRRSSKGVANSTKGKATFNVVIHLEIALSDCGTVIQGASYNEEGLVKSSTVSEDSHSGS